MSNSQRFDEHIKEQFLEYTPQVHPRIWDNIIKEREKRRPIIFWFNFFNSKTILLIAGLLIVSSAGTYFIFHTKPDINQNNSTARSIEKNEGPQIPLTPPFNNTIKKATKATIANLDKSNTAEIHTSNTFQSLKENAGESKMKVQSSDAEEDKAYQNTTKKSSNIESNNDHTIGDAHIIMNSDLLQESRLSKLYFIAEKSASEKQTLSLRQRLLSNINLPGCPLIEKDAAGNKRYFEIYAGPDIAFRSLSDTGNSAYLQKRRESTSFSSAYSAGLRYTQVFSNGMSIRTGVNYSQINEKFTYVKGNLIQITYIINANGDTTGTYITTGTRYKTTHNKFRTIDIPLVMGYEIGNGRIHANINAGVIVNAYSWQKGEILDTTLNPVNINTGKSNSPYQFKTNIGLGFLAGVSFYYKLNEKVHLLAEPYFRYNLTPMSNENLTFKQKYNTSGIRLGIRVDLH
ncbi:MAG: hypothetical protein WCG67_00070 [Ferruginibacter sp.]